MNCTEGEVVGNIYENADVIRRPATSLFSNMPACAACGHPGTTHYSGPQRKQGKCAVRKDARRCVCTRYIPRTDEKRPANRLIGILRRPKGR
jgi:hypothetical protein